MKNLKIAQKHTMRNSKLVKLLQHFSKTELTQLNEFVYSPFFNKNKNVQKLMDYIGAYAPKFDSHNFNYENAYSSIFNDKSYQKETIIKLLSKLFKLTEEFIAHFQLKENQLMNKVEILKYYNTQHLTNYFESTLKKIRKAQESSKIKDDNWIYQQLLIEHEFAFFLSANADDGTGDINLQHTNNTLDSFYLQRKLRYFCFMKNRQRSVNHPFEFTLKKELDYFFENGNYKNDISITIWWSAYNLLCNQNSKNNYLQLKSALENNSESINSKDKRTLYTYLENTAKFIYSNYFEELFSLYENQLNQKIIYQDGYLIPVVFKNIVTVALRLKKFDWTAHFIETHRTLLFPENKEREDIYFLCLAMLYFEKGSFEEALEIMNHAKMNNLYIKLEERRLRLKIYFEIDYQMVFEDNINSFRKFLSEHRKLIAKYYLEGNRNFINIIYYLFKTANHETKRIQKLKQMIADSAVLPERKWIEKKLSNL